MINTYSNATKQKLLLLVPLLAVSIVVGIMFIGKSGVTYGWKNTMNNYKKGYPSTEAMGKLNFNLIQIKKLSRKYYHVTGKWHLTRTSGDLQGHFTLLLKKMKGRWLIISDHSS
jgi:ketosteroid isomerase-like protein